MGDVLRQFTAEIQSSALSGPIQQLSSYPAWVKELVEGTAAARAQVVQHGLFRAMCEGTLSRAAERRFLVDVWPVIVRFPQYMAQNLMKLRYGRARGHTLARKFLLQNMRVEAKHAEFWLQWAAACGVTEQDVLFARAPASTRALSHWCWHVCERESLAAGIAATNFAIEGATGEWCSLICDDGRYETRFFGSDRANAMKWLRVHARYDDSHPWEALEIVATILGADPPEREVACIRSTVAASYAHMEATLDYCLSGRDGGGDAHPYCHDCSYAPD
ncbi:MAG: TenA family transcriptional regulator [Rhodocyclaceae bacterium]|nr:TenA family transcriptional regulator [Rhodocyclaceae bacterium]